MDLGDLLAGLFTPGESRRGAGRVERILGWIVLAGIVLMAAFVWLVYSGF